jgi:hypothetical protein
VRRKKPSASKATPVEPYCPAAPGDRLRDEIRSLIGFDIGNVQERGWAWLLRHGFLRKDELGNLIGVQHDDRPTLNRAKADALSDVLRGLSSTDFMYAPERLAGRRWHAALSAAAAALESFVPYARARSTEDSYFAGRTTGGGHDAVVAVTTDVQASAERLLARMKEAAAQIITYEGDPLPGLEEGRRPHRAYLGKLEAILSVAGFSYRQIADLIWDTNRAEDERAKARTAERSHVERIRKRVAQLKPEVVLHKKKEAVTNQRMDQFLERTGLQIHDAIDAWTQSIEFKALDRDLKRLNTAARGGK